MNAPLKTTLFAQAKKNKQEKIDISYVQENFHKIKTSM